MQAVEFFSLTRAVQERFIGAAHAQGAPLPILVRQAPPPFKAIGWGVGAVAFFAAWVGFVGVGYGNLDSSLALFPLWTIGAQAALIAGCSYCVLRARAAYRGVRSLPFLPSVYLFPIGVIDARSSRLVQHSLIDLTSAEPSGSGVKLRFDDGSSFQFSVPAERRAEALTVIAGHRDKIKGLGEDNRERELVLLDPLRDNGFKNPFSPTDSLRPGAKNRKLGNPVFAVLIGALVAAGAFFVRNYLSEANIYAEARTRDTISGYGAYLARGGGRGEVKELLLPRAELKLAAQAGSVDAVERYMQAHEGSKIAVEIQAVLRTALLAELGRAEAKESLAALTEFQGLYQKHGLVDSELAEARKRYLASVLAKFSKQAKADPELVEFARSLIAWGAEHGPKAVVRFRRRMPTTLEDIEKELFKSQYFAGSATLPSHFMDADHLQARETRYGAELIARLQPLFPEELVHFELGPTVDDAIDDGAKVTTPTLSVAYHNEVSGVYLSRKPRAALTGLGIFMKVQFALPNQDNPLTYKYTGWHAPDVKKVETGELEVTQVYDDLADKAFHKFLKKYGGTWFKDSD